MQKANCNFTRFSLCLSISLTKSYNNIILLTIYKKPEVTIIFMTSDSLYLFYTVLTPKSASLSGLSFPCFSFILNCCICFNASSWHSFSALIFLCYLLFSSLLHTFFFQTAKTLQIRQYMILHIIHISNRFPVNACKVKITGQKKISDILFTISPITFITVFVTSTNQVRYNTETSYLLKSLQRLVQAEAMQ